MSDPVELVTVYRSGDSDSDQDAEAVQNYLAANGLDAVIFNDDQPGVVKGSAEVRVAAADVEQAESLLTSFDPDAPMIADPSRDLDMVTIFSGMGATAEVEALSINSVLESYDIPTVIIGDSALPNLEFQVQVPRTKVLQARQALAEAEASGPAGAIEAERESEANLTGGPQA
jgi:hypothetical protein